MGAIRMLCANDLRRRWLATAAIALLVGVIGAVVLAAAAGARRSSTALHRFNTWSRASNVEVDTGAVGIDQLNEFARAIGSPPLAIVHAHGMSPTEAENTPMGAPIDDRLGTTVDRARVIHGRLANPNATDEINVGEALAKQLRLKVGSTVEAVSLTGQQVAAQKFYPPEGPQLRFRVVGIVRRPLDLGDRAASGGIIALTPAFDRAYHDRIAYFTGVLRIRVDGGTPAVARVSDTARKMFGGNGVFKFYDYRAENDSAQNAIDVVTTAIWIFALVAAIAGLFTIAIIVFREIGRNRPVQSTLSSIGLTRRDRVAAMLPRAFVIGGGGALLAVLGAIALSPLLPFGIARRAEPDPGVHADWFVLLLGALFVVVFITGVGLAAAIRSTRTEAVSDAESRRSLADFIGIGKTRPVIATGVRMALDPGRHDRAVPVRSAAAGATLGVIGIAAVLVFSASFRHVSDSPRLYGWTWDVKARDPSPPDQTTCDTNALGLDRVHGVTDVGAICYREADVDQHHLLFWSFTRIRGGIAPEIVSGRAPATDDEILLGRNTLNALHKRIGDPVHVDTHGRVGEYRIVGESVFPQLTYGDAQPLADGAVVTNAGYQRVRPQGDDETNRYIVVRTAHGASAAKLAQLISAQPMYHQADGPDPNPDTITTAVRPAEIERIRHTSWLLPSLAALLALLALTGVAHALINSVRTRRHDLAVLKALGFRPRQVRAAVSWQATTLAMIGLVVGIPLGIIIGRLTWSTIAHNTGLGPDVTIPALAIALLVPAALLLVNVVAYLPARAAARMRATTALAAE